jgi:hypothetical protein
MTGRLGVPVTLATLDIRLLDGVHQARHARPGFRYGGRIAAAERPGHPAEHVPGLAAARNPQPAK